MRWRSCPRLRQKVTFRAVLIKPRLTLPYLRRKGAIIWFCMPNDSGGVASLVSTVKVEGRKVAAAREQKIGSNSPLLHREEDFFRLNLPRKVGWLLSHDSGALTTYQRYGQEEEEEARCHLNRRRNGNERNEFCNCQIYRQSPRRR